MSDARFRMLDLTALGDDDLDQWRRLGDNAIEPNPYLDPRYAVPLLSFGDHVDARLAVVEDGETWLAAAAVMPRRMQLLKREYTVMSTGGALTDQLGRTNPLVASVDPAGALASLVQGIARQSRPGLVQFDDYFADGPLASALDEAVRQLGAPTLRDQRGLQPYTSKAWPGTTVDQDVYGPSYASKGRRMNMRRYARSLSAHLGVPLNFVLHGPDRSAFDEFVQLQASGWKGDAARGGAALALRQEELDAFTRVYEACANDGTMAVGGLYAGARPVHLSVFLTDNRNVTCVVVEAYDEEFGEYRAGSLGRLAAVAHMRTAFPGRDFDPAIRYPTADVSGVYPDRRPMAGVTVGAGSRAGRLLVRLANVARSARPQESGAE